MSNRYDVLFLGHFTTTHALGALVLYKLRGIPYVILSHANDLSYSVSTMVDKLVARSLIRNAALMIGNSRLTAELIHQKGYDKTVEVINPGVDTELFHSEVDTTEVLRKYSLDNHRVLLTVARLVEKKNVDGVLFALPEVIKRVPNVLLLVAGEGEDRKRLEILCDKLELRPHVQFLGFIENNQLPALYCASELFIMVTKDIESFGISFLEANACEKPVIASEIAGVTEAVIDSETGLLVDPHDTNAITEAIVCLLTNEKLARRLGENGRRRAVEELSWEKVAERFDDALMTCLNSRRIPGNRNK